MKNIIEALNESLLDNAKGGMKAELRDSLDEDTVRFLDYLDSEGYDYIIDEKGCEGKKGMRIIVTARLCRAKAVFDVFNKKYDEFLYTILDLNDEEVMFRASSIQFSRMKEEEFRRLVEPIRYIERMVDDCSKNIQKLRRKNPRDLDNPYSELGQARARKVKYEKWIEKIR